MKEIEKKVYDYIAVKSMEGISPSIREICAALDIKSTSTAARYVENLVTAGLLEKDGRRNRTIRLVAGNFAKIPVIGTINDTENIMSAENIAGYITVSLENKCTTGKLFALRMQDEGMINAGILKNDIIVIDMTEQTGEYENSKPVAALINGKYAIRNFYKENGRYCLQPENDDFDSIAVEECNFLGKAVAVVRYL